jgi:voltage-gated potassium channel
MHSLKFRLKISLIAFVVVMVLGTVGFMIIEKTTLLDAAYFVIVTMATVGYGDIHPVTSLGKIFSVVIIAMGVGTFLGGVASVTETMLAKREIEGRMQKLNMVIGVFYSEVGITLLADFSRYDPAFDVIRPDLIITGRWSDGDFIKAGKKAMQHAYSVEMSRVDLPVLKAFLQEKRDFLVRLLENPVLLEHQSFTDLLRAVFHLVEELAYRPSYANVPAADMEHLAGDIKRAYHLLVTEWIAYMKYLKNNYPFLFSLAVRTNPFDDKASVVVSGG